MNVIAFRTEVGERIRAECALSRQDIALSPETPTAQEEQAQLQIWEWEGGAQAPKTRR